MISQRKANDAVEERDNIQQNYGMSVQVKIVRKLFQKDPTRRQKTKSEGRKIDYLVNR